jgi:queuine tRNA-ribosyltransferase
LFSFEIQATDGNARAGRLTTSHGVIETPAFVPVATQATVRAVSGDDLEQIGTQVIIANAYHLHLMPGGEVIRKMGGLHRFAGWRKPVITDSGGFQVFSLGAAKEHGVGKIASIFTEDRDRGEPLGSRRRKQFVKIDEEGVGFTSYLDGSQHRFTPESVVQLEMKLGADIMLALDECTSPLHDYEYTMAAMERTHRWAVRALEEYRRMSWPDQAIFGIVQGGAYRDLREKSAGFIGSRGFHGFAIGGSLGKSKEEMYRVLEWTLPLLSHERPRHLLGIGTVEDVFGVVSQGIDLFDCVAPTRMARSGTVFVRGGEGYRIHLLNAKYREDRQPIDENCACPTCKRYSRAYLRHLFAAKEQAGERLAAIHNLYFMERMLEQIRGAIKTGKFEALKKEWLGWRTS